MTTLQGKKILVVDDEEGIRDLVVSEFEFNGATCFQAASGREAFEIYKQNTLDAVVSDIRMPDGDGIYFLEEVKKSKSPLCTMIFMTGYSDIPLEEFYDRGVEAVISKPFRLEHLVSTLQMAMQTPRMGWRRAPRVVASLNVEVSWPELAHPLKTTTFTVGRGGLFVQSSAPFPKVGSKVKFSVNFTVEGQEQSIDGHLVVRWIRSDNESGLPLGFGAQFSGLPEEDMDQIASIAGLLQGSRTFIPKK